MSNPDGTKRLERDAAFYDRAILNRPAKAVAPWHEREARTVTLYPALVLAAPHDPILDVGCGVGCLAAMCWALGVPYHKGIDFSEEALRVAAYHAPDARFEQCNIFEYDYTFGGYGVAVVIEVLEHVYRDLDLLQLIPKGRAVVGSVPNFYTPGHVRWFAGPGEVRARYEKVLDVDRIVVEKAAKTDNEWYIFRGMRCA